VNIAFSQTSDTLFVESYGLKLHTVLTTPEKANKRALAIIIAGSGPTDLNGNQMKNKNNSLLFLSDELVKNNIATVRFDKRGIAKSSYAGFNENSLIFDNYSDDIVSLIDFYSKKGFKKIFIIGHSEGSLLGLIASKQRKIAGFVSLCGAGNPIDVTLKNQLRPQLPPAMFAEAESIIDSLKSGHLVKNVSSQMNMLFRHSVQPYMISWFKYDPAELVKNINIPLLIIQGDKDIQVTTAESNILHNASPSSSYAIIKDMNHVLKTIKGDINENVASYTNPDMPVNNELVSTIVKFIK
jgi:hypothetical protein